MDKKTILIVDDNDHMRAVLAFMLKKYLNVECAMAKNGHDALGRIYVIKPDLVLLDINMPGMGGIEALKKIRESPIDEIKNVPVIMITASRDKCDVEKVVNLKINGYIAKPIDEKKTIALIRQIFIKDVEL